MDEIIQMSNDYSGVLNPRQTWEVSYEGCQVTDQYDNVEYIEAIRYENGRAEKIVDGVYYNLMVMPDMREKAREMMQQAITFCQQK